MIRQNNINIIPKENSFRWVMLALVWLLYFSFGITSVTIAPLVVPIINDLNISYTQMGFILGAWQLVYIITSYPLGIVIDKLSIRKSLGVGILLIWFSLIFRGMAVDFLTLLFAVGLFGFGGPIISIGAPKVVSVWFKGNERGLAAGIYSTGPSIGAAVALATAAPIVVPLSGTWRGISLIYGIVVFITILMWWMFAKNADKDLNQVKRVSAFETFWTLLSIRNVRIIMVLAISTFLLNHGLNNWIPTLLQEKGMSLSEGGVWAAISMLSGVIGLMVIPSIARKGYRIITLAGIFIVASSTTFGLLLFTDNPLYLSLIISNIVRAPMMPVLTLILMETKGVGAIRMGAAGGLFFAAAEIGGFSGPFILGVVRDITGNMDLGLLILGVFIVLLIILLPIIKEN